MTLGTSFVVSRQVGARRLTRLEFCSHLDLYLWETARLSRLVCLHQPAPTAGPLHLALECNSLSQQKSPVQQRRHRITRIKNRSTMNCATDARRVEVIVQSVQRPQRERTELHGKTERTEIYYTLLQVADEKRTYILLLFFISWFYVLYMSINVYSFDKVVWTVSAVLCFWVVWTCSGKSTDRSLSLRCPRFGKWPKNWAHNGNIHGGRICFDEPMLLVSTSFITVTQPNLIYLQENIAYWCPVNSSSLLSDCSNVERYQGWSLIRTALAARSVA